jgi:hypothetical protein
MYPEEKRSLKWAYFSSKYRLSYSRCLRRMKNEEAELTSRTPPLNYPDNMLGCHRSTTRASTSLAITTNGVQRIIFTFLFFLKVVSTGIYGFVGHLIYEIFFPLFIPELNKPYLSPIE